MIPLLISALVGTLVSQAEKLFPAPKSGATKKQWVLDMVNELLTILTTHVPTWAANFIIPSESAIASVLSEAIEAAVSKLKALPAAK